MNTILTNAIRAHVAGMRKAAAAEQAYAEGFCKAAEALGVDPRALAKRADWFPWGLALGVTGLGLGVDALVGYLNGKANRARRAREDRMHRELVSAMGLGRLGRTGVLGAGGAGVGALLGNYMTDDPDKKRRNAMIGALLGGATGAAAANADKITGFVTGLVDKARS